MPNGSSSGKAGSSSSGERNRVNSKRGLISASESTKKKRHEKVVKLHTVVAVKL